MTQGRKPKGATIMCAFRIRKELAIKLREEQNQTMIVEKLLEKYFDEKKKGTK